MILKHFKDFLLKPTKFHIIDKYLKKKGVKILDIGCGNHSATLIKKYYPFCKYYGVDKRKDYNNNKKDFNNMEKFYKIDLSKGNLDKIENDNFDAIIFSHVIEHLMNGEDIIKQLSKKLKKGGILFVETPSPHSKYMPKVKGTLNFYSDNTHLKIYSVPLIKKVLKQAKFNILKSGLKIHPKRVFFFPIYFFVPLLKNKFSWEIIADITGVASYVLALKK